MGSVGWEALRYWGPEAVRVERLSGGVANDVWSVRVEGRLAVGRLGTRSDADLAWETDLLQHLGRAGLTVPHPELCEAMTNVWWSDDDDPNLVARFKGRSGS